MKLEIRVRSKMLDLEVKGTYVLIAEVSSLFEHLSVIFKNLPQ